MRVAARLRTVLLALVLLLAAGNAAGQQVSRARALLFYSPTCPHCHQVMTVDLPPLVREHGARLQIVTVDVTTERGQELYRAAIGFFSIPEERYGVPTLIMGSTVLVGSGEIPTQFPGMVQRALAGEGAEWPAMPELRSMLAEQGLLDPPAAPAARADSAAGARPDTVAARQPVAAPVAPAARVAGPDTAVEATSAPAASADSGALAARDTFAAASPGLTVLGAEAPTLSMAERFRLDPAGNTIAVVVLLGMLAALAAVLVAWARRSAWPEVADWLIPVLALAGAGIAAYLAFVEVTGARAVCGPVGDCNTVQQSAYARIAGVLPVGVAGLVGYLLVLGAWAVAVAGPLKLRAQAGLVLWASALLGTVYSAYLTFLEPFVIGATCAWCISSALVMTALLLLSTPRAVASRDTAWRA